MYRLGKPAVTTLAGTVVAVAACALGIAFRMNPAWLVVAAGILGILMPQRFTQEPAPKSFSPKEEDTQR